MASSAFLSSVFTSLNQTVPTKRSSPSSQTAKKKPSPERDIAA